MALILFVFKEWNSNQLGYRYTCALKLKTQRKTSAPIPDGEFNNMKDALSYFETNYSNITSTVDELEWDLGN